MKDFSDEATKILAYYFGGQEGSAETIVKAVEEISVLREQCNKQVLTGINRLTSKIEEYQQRQTS